MTDDDPRYPQHPDRRVALVRLALAAAVLSAALGSGVATPVWAEDSSYESQDSEDAPDEEDSPDGEDAPDEEDSPDEVDEPDSGDDHDGGDDHSDEPDVEDGDDCRLSNKNLSEITFSEEDMERAEAAVEAGYAKPLDFLWPIFTEEYHGRIISIEFTGFQWRPRYRFRAIGTGGRLETVIISAKTGKIIRVVRC